MNSTMRQLATADIEPWPDLNPRTRFEQAELEELAQSIRENGLLLPLLVHDRGPSAPPPRFWLIAGERRWRASQRAGLERVSCRVGTYTEAEALAVSLTENIQRQELSAIEEAHAFRRWLDVHADATQTGLADRIGKSQAHVSHHLRLLKLPADVQDLIADGELSAAHGKEILKLEREEDQIELAERAANNGLSVSSIKRILRLEYSTNGTRRQRAPKPTTRSAPKPAKTKKTKHAAGGRTGVGLPTLDDLRDGGGPIGARVDQDDHGHWLVLSRLPVATHREAVTLARRINYFRNEDSNGS